MSSIKESVSMEKETGYSFSMTPNVGTSAYEKIILKDTGNISYLESWFSQVIINHEVQSPLFKKIRVPGHLENIIVLHKILIPSEYQPEILEVYCQVNEIT